MKANDCQILLCLLNLQLFLTPPYVMTMAGFVGTFTVLGMTGGIGGKPGLGLLG